MCSWIEKGRSTPCLSWMVGLAPAPAPGVSPAPALPLAASAGVGGASCSAAARSSPVGVEARTVSSCARAAGEAG
eukprot:CAMPEP_0180029290 /NCGR_PEP_ID=MMETSP0984-20121128/26750_1 /TAXON_ID=483367 /ORGANISM="non described non described, Strain CCMP 2436" /LENGTH=74 /DNA_ID=CAMNT_0021954259 /DNA_START=50 /DNA_END=271 /DNA_ORIENTATION=+